MSHARHADTRSIVPKWVHDLFFEDRITSIISVFALTLILVLPGWIYFAVKTGGFIGVHITCLVITVVGALAQIRDLGPQGRMIPTWLNDWVYHRYNGELCPSTIEGGKWGVPILLFFGLDEAEKQSTGTLEVTVAEFEALSKDDIPLKISLRALTIIEDGQAFAALEVEDPSQEAALSFKTGAESVIRKHYYDDVLPDGKVNTDLTLKDEALFLKEMMKTEMVKSFVQTFGLSVPYVAVLGPSPQSKYVEQKQDLRNKRRNKEVFDELCKEHGKEFGAKLFAFMSGYGKIIDITGTGNPLVKAAAVFKEM